MDDNEIATWTDAKLAKISDAALKGLQKNDFLSLSDAKLQAMLSTEGRVQALTNDQANWVVEAYKTA